MNRLKRSLLFGAAVAGAAFASASAQAEVVIGLMCDRTGPTQIVGNTLCPGYQDYVDLVNSKGGLVGQKVRLVEIDTQYKVPIGVEAYERFKQEGAVLISLYGTPITQALQKRLEEDKVPGTSPGFGTAASANGKKFPYLYPMAASYWSQGAAAVKYAGDQMGGIKGKKIAYIYYDNPAGREAIPILKKLSGKLGFELKEFAVPPPGVEMKAQVLDITRRYRANFVISHLFGKAPSVSIKEFKRAGFKLKNIVGLVWAGSEVDVKAAGGWKVAEGYSVLQFAGVGKDYPVLQEIRDLYKKKGKSLTSAMDTTVFYNRGVYQAAAHLKAIENAIKSNPGKKVTGKHVRDGFEQIKNFQLGGIVPPLTFTDIDHEGGGWVRVFQAKGGKFVPVSEWIQGYRSDVMELVASH